MTNEITFIRDKKDYEKFRCFMETIWRLKLDSSIEIKRTEHRDHGQWECTFTWKTYI